MDARNDLSSITSIPVKRLGCGEIRQQCALDDDHVADQMIAGATSIWVCGVVRHRQHAAIHLPSWYKAIRNKAIRHGRFGQGKDAD